MAIIAFSGKIGSGKDLCGKIIQYLTQKENTGKTIDEYFKQSFENRKHQWQIVKFADALKDIVCILTGCTREQLEDIDFKNSKLNDDWITYSYGIIERGKQTGKRKNISLNTYNKIIDVNEQIHHDARVNNSLTYRELLQKLGTDLLRNQLHENVWVNALFSKYTKYLYQYDKNSKDLDEGYTWKDPNWIITDCRFENEAKAVKDRSGILIRVNREDITSQNKLNPHTSETALDNYKFDYIIDNNSTIEDLIIKVKEILIKENII